MAIQFKPNQIYLFLGKKSVMFMEKLGDTFPKQEGIWALVDSGPGVEQPQEFLGSESWFIVQSTSHQLKRWKWKKQKKARFVVMKPWTWDEIYIGGTILYHPPVDAGRLLYTFHRFGPFARSCIDLADPENQKDIEADIPGFLENCENLNTLANEVAQGTVHVTKNNLASCIMTVYPSENRRPRCRLASPYIASEVVRALASRDDMQFWQLFKRFQAISETRGTAGWMWEPYIMAFFKGLRGESGFYEATALKPPLPPREGEPDTKHRRPNPDIFKFKIPFRNSIQFTLSSLLTSLHFAKEYRVLFDPGAPNIATIDAFSVHTDGTVSLPNYRNAPRSPTQSYRPRRVMGFVREGASGIPTQQETVAASFCGSRFRSQ